MKATVLGLILVLATLASCKTTERTPVKPEKQQETSDRQSGVQSPEMAFLSELDK